MSDRNYTVFHLHDDRSLLDSCTKFKSYVQRAKELGMKAIASTNHGNIYNWVTSKNICDEYGIKFIFGVEIYLTEKLEPKVRDNYHTVLLAKNEQGIKEICSLVSLSNRKDHKYFKPRITFDEFKNISDNVIKTSACLSSPLWRLYKEKRFDDVADLAKHYDYLEIQPHLISEQATFNQVLLRLSKKFGIPLIAGTDTHSLDSYKAECRTLMMISKEILFKDRKSESDDSVDTEEQCDLTFKTYDELVEMFDKQGVLPRKIYLEAIENTNRMSDMVEDFVLDTSFKYPVLYDDEVPRTKKLVMSKLKEKIQNHVIPMKQVPSFLKRIKEEFAVFEKIEMVGFMLFMSELVTWIKEQGMPVGTGRGSCLTAGNLVLTSNGYVPIEEVKVGDYVYTHKGRLKRVTDTQKFNVNERLYTFSYQGQDKDQAPLTSTADHKFLTKRGWVKAEDITLDDYFCCPYAGLSKNKWLKIKTITLSKPQGTTVYDITVEDDHSFIVDKIVSHNCCGSVIAYLLDITDVNPVKWNTIFSRFANEYRKELGDIDIDLNPNDRPRIYQYIFDKFGHDKSSYVLALGTVADKGTIDLIAKAIKDENGKTKYDLDKTKEIKELFSTDEQKARELYPDLFYYFDGINNTYISQSMHPAGVIVSPINLRENYGTFTAELSSKKKKKGEDEDDIGLDGELEILQLDMEDSHHVNLVKYDLLALKSLSLMQDTCDLVGIPYPKAHELDWNDEKVYQSLADGRAGLFQFERMGSYQSLLKFGCHSVEDITLVTAAVRPSGESYRERLFNHERNATPTPEIAELLKNSYGFIVYQCDIIAFLQKICGLSGGEADLIRRFIAKKNHEKMQKYIPKILDGYCNNSKKDRAIAEEECKAYLKVIEDASSYSFG